MKSDCQWGRGSGGLFPILQACFGGHLGVIFCKHEPEVFVLALPTRVLAQTTVLQYLHLVLAVQVVAKAPANIIKSISWNTSKGSDPKRKFTQLLSFSSTHNSPIYNECQTKSAKVLVLPWKRAHQDNSNDTPQPICEFQVSFPWLRIRINQDKP